MTENRIIYDTRFNFRSGYEYIIIGPVPNDEDCLQLDSEKYSREMSVLECNVYIDQLIRTKGIPLKADLFIICNTGHDAGLYYEVAIRYPIQTDDEENVAEEEALEFECGLDNWDEIALSLLEEHKHPLHYTKIIHLKKTA